MSDERNADLVASRDGDPGATSRLVTKVYDNLRALANHRLRDVRGRVPSLRPTALVHEVFVKLVESDGLEARSRTHFYAIASRAMQQVLVDHIRSRERLKRGAGWSRITLDDADAILGRDSTDLDALSDALIRLANVDDRAASVVQMRFFGGMATREIGDVLGVSERTVRGDWLMARAWLRLELAEENPS